MRAKCLSQGHSYCQGESTGDRNLDLFHEVNSESDSLRYHYTTDATEITETRTHENLQNMGEG